jgi:hypothetical protein
VLGLFLGLFLSVNFLSVIHFQSILRFELTTLAFSQIETIQYLTIRWLKLKLNPQQTKSNRTKKNLKNSCLPTTQLDFSLSSDGSTHTHKTKVWNKLQMFCWLPHAAQMDKDKWWEMLGKMFQIQFLHTRTSFNQKVVKSSPLVF